MEGVAPEYDFIVLGTGNNYPAFPLTSLTADPATGLTECVLSG